MPRLVVRILIATSLAVAPALAQTGGVTPARLAGLKATVNDPAGDAFVDTPAALDALLDALAADTSRVGPMQLFLASNTALRRGRIEDAGFFFFAAQIRVAFDFDRFDVSPRADGNNAATYLGFLRQTIGSQVNPAVMKDRKAFAAVVARLERWDPVPAAAAYYPEFEKARVKLPQVRWAETAGSLKTQFLTKFARRTLTLLNDDEYHRALLDVQAVTLATTDPGPGALDRVAKGFERMAAVEARLFPGEPRQTPSADLPDAPAKATADASADVAPPPPTPAPNTIARPGPDDAPRRVGAGVPEPKKLRHVDPKFPSGARGSVILEATISRRGTVEAVSILRADPRLAEPAEEAVRQWVFAPASVNGIPVSVILTVSLTARPDR
jgi:TonB family protein